MKVEMSWAEATWFAEMQADYPSDDERDLKFCRDMFSSFKEDYFEMLGIYHESVKLARQDICNIFDKFLEDIDLEPCDRKKISDIFANKSRYAIEDVYSEMFGHIGRLETSRFYEGKQK